MIWGWCGRHGEWPRNDLWMGDETRAGFDSNMYTNIFLEKYIAMYVKIY